MSDVIDIHDYPDHPVSERTPDGGWIWSVGQRSMLGAAFEHLPAMAQWRVAGKPFVVSEFDLNPPNDHASETMPLLSLMSAYQGWSGFAEFAWFNFQKDDLNRDRINSAFATSGHAGQIAFMPASAMLLREKLVRPAQTRATLEVGDERLRATDLSGIAVAPVWQSQNVDRSDGWQTALAVSVKAGDELRLQGQAPTQSTNGKFATDTGQIRFDRSKPGAETMTVNAPALRMAFGHTGGKSFELGDAKIRVEPGTRENYANLAVVALDGLPLVQSRKVLVTAVARVENKGMIYNADRTSVGKEWGEGPTLAEPVKFSVSLPGAGWRASVLDGKGRVTGALKMSGATLRVSQPSSLWYLLERP